MFTCHFYILFQLFMYEAMGLCPPGRGGELIDSVEWIPNKKGNTFSTGFSHFIFEIKKITSKVSFKSHKSRYWGRAGPQKSLRKLTGPSFPLVCKVAGICFVCVGGAVCRVGGRWVVNPSGGLESKGEWDSLNILHKAFGCCLKETYRIQFFWDNFWGQWACVRRHRDRVTASTW